MCCGNRYTTRAKPSTISLWNELPAPMSCKGGGVPTELALNQTQVAEALAEIQNPSFRHLLVPLMYDPAREVAEALRHEGHDAVQTTVSRDIAQLGLVKVRFADGRFLLPHREKVIGREGAPDLPLWP